MEHTVQVVGKESLEKEASEINNATINVGNRLRHIISLKEFLEVNAKLQSKKSAQEKIDELKERIRDLQNSTEVEASRLKELNSQSMEPQRKNLASELAEGEKQKEELERELGNVTSAISHKKVLLNNLQNQPSSVHRETSVSVSRIRAGYSLYLKLSNMKWDYTVPNGHIKGFVLKPEEKRVIPFKFDQTSHSQFFITNYLWEQISTSSDFLEGTTSHT